MVEHLETVKLLPLPGHEESPADLLDIELMRDDSVLFILRTQNNSFQISKEETVKLVAALRRGLEKAPA